MPCLYNANVKVNANVNTDIKIKKGKNMKFKPCIDIHDGKVKQIVGGTLRDDGGAPVTNFESDKTPEYFAELYKKNNLLGGHVIMLGKSDDNERAAIRALAAYPQGLQVGGGINPTNAQKFLDAGASHVIVTSYVFADGVIKWERLDELLTVVQKNKLVLDLSCRKVDGDYFVATDRWQKITQEKLCAKFFEKLSAYCDEFLVHAADVEGLMRGVDEEVVRLLANESPIASTYAGGVRDVGDLDIIDKVGRGRVDVTVGSALDIFGGTLSFDDVVKRCG